MITRLTKGQQITLPSAVRRKLHIEPGSRVEIELREDEAVIRSVTSDIKDFFRRAKHIKARQHLSAAQMDELVDEVNAEQ